MKKVTASASGVLQWKRPFFTPSELLIMSLAAHVKTLPYIS